jgi:hypothetical protein
MVDALLSITLPILVVFHDASKLKKRAREPTIASMSAA